MSEGKRILIIDNDDVLTDMLSEQLTEMEQFICTTAQSGANGLDQALKGYFDLILLTVELADMSGREVCRRMRAGGVNAPIILLTQSDSDTDTIRGLNAGATDCVTKPFKLGVLVARIRAHIRQFEHSDEAVLGIGPFAFRPGAKVLEAPNSGNNGGGQHIRLTDKESQILKFLYLHGDRVVSRDELLGEVWGYNAGVTTHTLETHVYRLRQKMEHDPSHAELLITEPGGYRLVP